MWQICWSIKEDTMKRYTIFDELYRQIWSIFGTAQSGFSGYSSVYPRSRFSSDTVLRKQYPEPVVNALCMRIYSINLSSMLGEFIRIMQGHLQCISSSSQMRKEIDPDIVLNEFAVLYTLVLQPASQRKLSPIFSISTAIIDSGNRVKRIMSKYPRFLVEKLLIESAQKCKDGKLKSLNYLLLDYLFNIGDRRTELFRKLSIVVGHSSYQFQYQQHRYDRYEHFDRYEPYDKYRRHALLINFILQQLLMKKRMPTMEK